MGEQQTVKAEDIKRSTHSPFPRPKDWKLLESDHVLVVDDERSNRLYIAELLRAAGYRVTEAAGGAEALQAVMELQPDLILLDVMMPDVDGFTVCEHLKSNELTRLIPVVLVTGLTDSPSLVRGLEAGADDLLNKRFEPMELLARVRSSVHQKRLNEDLDHTANVLFAIARTVESRDPTTGDHCERLVKMGEDFGRYLSLSRHQIKALRWGGYLHDIGKIGIPDAVLGKTGKHTPEEWEIMKSHVIIGENICQSLRTMQDVLPIIRHHHERWDGSGYPDRLQEDEIPLLARIFQVIDIYDALTSQRPYKKAFTVEEAVAILREETRKGWRDPNLVREFCDYIFVTNLKLSDD
ncbi:MAG: response regulator [Cyanobacteriota bacterium]|nr:response regulator [Cyanobacteriota bacterium]